MKRVLPSSALLALAVPLFAQGAPEGTGSRETGVRVHIGYGFTSTFDKVGGRSAHLEGPEIGVALPVGTFRRSELLLEPSYFGGGRLAHGRDDDADVYRLTLFAHRTLAHGIGFRAGVGFASCTNSRGQGQFRGTSGAILDVGGEFPFSQRYLKGFAPYIDAHAIFGNDKLSGFFVGLGSRI